MKRSSDKIGLPPGTPIHIGQRRIDIPKILLVDYNAENIRIETATTPEHLSQPSPKQMLRWIHLSGVHDVELVQNVCKPYNIHPLVVEDVVNTEHRPKLEIHSEYIFIVLKVFNIAENEGVILEQISIILGQSFILTFQESADELFKSIMTRLQQSHGNLRNSGLDYLAYTILDVIVDQYFVFTESLSEQIEELEDEVIENPTTQTLQNMYRLKRIVSIARRNLWPLRENVGRIYREPSPLINPATGIYLRDLYDHVIQINDYLESYREALSSMLDTYLSSVSNKMNAVMKVLTVISTVFIPLTLIAGIYGMNFYNMPELAWPYGYTTIMLVMLILGTIMLAYFRKIEWI
ncbi:MAG: magnesium/cobalt transporter CorA [Candidatus Thorarchaeota archaeon]|nr:magnesium/cobalt transporter CorA [Candidatus Thorarchaeota archaeon]